MTSGLPEAKALRIGRRYHTPTNPKGPLLHATRSGDAVELADALIDGGADIEAPGGSFGRSTGQRGWVWLLASSTPAGSARRACGQAVHTAALGMLRRIEQLLRGASTEEINNAFWHACAGGQRRAAELLLAYGAGLNWIPHYAKQTALHQAGSIDTGREALIAC